MTGTFHEDIRVYTLMASLFKIVSVVAVDSNRYQSILICNFFVPFTWCTSK